MAYRGLADATVALHFAFILFVVFGGFLAWRRTLWAWLHLPAVAWVAWLEFTGAICPLTPLENALRARAGDAGYAGGFIEHYLVPVIYPAGLTPGIQIMLGCAVVALNVVVYGALWRRRRAAHPTR
jgi:Protein of Unknown function (DUF2784)